MIRRYFARELLHLYRTNYFRTDEQGRRLYIPGGSSNPFARMEYVVPDEATVQRIEAIELRWQRTWLLVLAGIFIALAALAMKRPDSLHPILLVSLPLVLLSMFPWLPLMKGGQIARQFGLQPEPIRRSLGERTTAIMGSTPGRAMWNLGLSAVIVCVFIALLVLDIRHGILRKQGVEFLVFMLALSLPGLLFVPAYFLAMRWQRAKAANERLEALVAERTAQLREIQVRLQVRVAAQVAQMERLGQLRHFFAAPVAELILRKEGFDPSRVHRKELSVVSMDLRGFTAFSETAEPEHVIEVLRPYHTRLGEVVNRFQATLEHFAGESAMVFLNDPLDAPDHPRRAIALTLELRKAIAPLVDEWQRLGYDLGWSAGIATGYATIGTVGYEGRWEYAAIGSVCNLAARLCAQAREGQIVTTHKVLSRAGEGVGLEALGDLVMKGVSRPVAGFNVVSLG